jgi:hypothetical protein
LSGLHRVREAARRDKQLQFTALLHHVGIPLLLDSFYALKRDAAPGVDGSDVERLRDGPGQAAAGFTPSRVPRDVSSATFQETPRTQSGWTTGAIGHRCPGRQNRPTDSGNSPWTDLGRGLSGILVQVPAGAKPACCAGCARDRVYEEEGELARTFVTFSDL